MILRFANCEVDPARVVLWRDGDEVRIEPQAFDVLCYLVERCGEVVRKEELLDHVWGDRFVSESALTTQIKSVRQAVGDDGSQQRIIRTVHGKGYELIAAVTVVDRDGPPAQAAGATAGHVSTIPASVQPLIGRGELIDVLCDVVTSNRLVTLVGTGGVGKTSVAYEVARRVERAYSDGVYLVELVTVLDPSATSEALATALDVNTRQEASVDDAIVDMLRPRTCLLLLDNCEHVIESVAALVSRILRVAPAVSVLATSREALAVTGERVRTVDPLPTGGGEDVASFDLASVPAVALFVERARAADPAFELDATVAPAVVEICRRLDGIPLAIELAASRARAIDVTEIADRLDERFRLLKGVRRGADPRHRTLHDAISWSYDLLDDDEQRVFAALAVFAGQFDLEAAEAVCNSGDVLDLLTRLTETSMLAVRRPPGGGTRYELLETLREYGRQRLDDTRTVELYTAHAEHFATVADAVAAGLQTPDEMLASARAEAAFADLRAAQRFALQVGDLDAAFGLISSIREYAMRALRYEAFAWAQAAATVPDAAGHPLQPMILGLAAYGAWVRGEYERAVALAHGAREAEVTHGIAPCGLVERVLGNVLLTTGRFDVGMVESARQLEIADESGNGSRIAHACYMWSVAASSTGARDVAIDLARRARAAAESTGSPTDLASAFVAEGFAESDDQRALDAFEAAHHLAQSAGNRWMSAFARTETSGLLLRRGLVSQAAELLAQMIDVWYRAGEWSEQWHTLTRCMIVLDLVDKPEIAAEVVGAIEAHATMGAPPTMASVREQAFRTRDSLRSKLGADLEEERRMVGASRPLATTVDRVRNALLGR